MGQKPSHQQSTIHHNNKPSILPFLWLLRGQNTTHNPNPEQPIKFQYKTKRKSKVPPYKVSNNLQTLNNFNRPIQNQRINNNNNNNGDKVRKIKNTNNLRDDKQCKVIKSQSEVFLRTKQISGDERKKHRRKSSHMNPYWQEDEDQQFGYEIQDVDTFLSKATIEKPANIPVVLAFPSVLYQTRIGGYQAEIALPLGMVVNAVFKNQHWLYVQTPHAEEGYVSYAACLPLGIIPPQENEDKPAPCWEISTDVFPKPSGNMTDTEKLSSKSDYGGTTSTRCHSSRSRNAASTCGERSFDRLYLRAAASAKLKGIRQTLLVIICDYPAAEENCLSVKKGEVVVLVDGTKDWFLVRNKNGCEGFIPAAVAGHGFL